MTASRRSVLEQVLVIGIAHFGAVQRRGRHAARIHIQQHEVLSPVLCSWRHLCRIGVAAAHDTPTARRPAEGRRRTPAPPGRSHRPVRRSAGSGPITSVAPRRWRCRSPAPRQRHSAARSGTLARRPGARPGCRPRRRPPAHPPDARQQRIMQRGAACRLDADSWALPAYQAAMPPISPPPPVATSTWVSSGASCSNSRATVPWPASMSAWS